MVKPLPFRNLLVALIGAAVYSALLWLSYGRAPYADIPAWWHHMLPNARVAVIGWFTLLNVGGAVLAAIPVALGVAFGATARKTTLALVVGVVPALYIVVGGFLEFGLPPQVDGWIVDIAQFLAVSLPVAALVALFRGFPLTIGWSDRGI